MSLRRFIPFGIFEPQKPRHFREMLRVVWENKHALPFAWRILNRGVCDGCSLGPYGLKDNVIKGTHLCLTRLKLLRLNTMRGFGADSLPDISALRKMTNEELHKLGRLSVPLRLRKGESRYSAISWDEALTSISSRIERARAAGQADRIGYFATSRGLTNETYYVLRKLASLSGTNNVDFCARLCHAASVDGLKDTLGIGAPTCSLSDMIGSDLVVIFGSNLANNQPVTTKYLHYAKKRGTKIVVVNPILEPGLERYWVPSIPSSALFGSKLNDHFFQVSIGGDIAFMSGVLKSLIAKGSIAEKFIRDHTANFQALSAHVTQMRWEDLEEHSGSSQAEMELFAEMYSKAKTAVFIYSMGLTQHRFGVDNVKALVNLALSRGMLGREKCGIIPIRGHSGVQGGGECGVDPGKLPGGFPVNPENVARFSKDWGAPVAAGPGLRVGQMLEAAHEGKIDLLYSVGGNLYETMPDPAYMREALERIDLRVHQDLVLNTSTVLEGNDVIILPAQTRYEQRGGGTATSTERRIRFTPEIPGPRVGESRAEWEILAQVGQKLYPTKGGPFSFSSAEEIRKEMDKVMPVYRGISDLREEGDHLQWGGAHLFSGGHFDKMPEGRATFTVVPIPDIEIPEGAVYVTTRRGKQFNSMTYGPHDPLMDRMRKDILISKADAELFGLKEGDPVSLVSETGQMTGICRIAQIRPRNVQVYWPEGNAIISRRYDPVSGEPDYNALAKIQPVAARR